MAGVGAAADKATVRKLSLQMNRAMASLEKDPNRRGWFRLFRHMDNDHSGKTLLLTLTPTRTLTPTLTLTVTVTVTLTLSLTRSHSRSAGAHALMRSGDDAAHLLSG